MLEYDSIRINTYDPLVMCQSSSDIVNHEHIDSFYTLLLSSDRLDYNK